MSEFTTEYAAPCERDPERAKAFELWARYHVACEEYDRTVCVARGSDGIAIPITSAERRLCNAHAHEQVKTLYTAAGDIPREVLARVRSETARWSFDDLKAYVDKLV